MSIGRHYRGIAFVLLFGVLMVVAVLRTQRSWRRPPPKTAAPVASYVAPPIPPEEPWGPLKRADSDLPPAVDDVLAHKCRRCHGAPTRHGAPFALYTWADTRVGRNGQPIYERIRSAVETGFMPNLIPANPPVERLTEAEKKILLDWVAAGGPSASAGRSPAPTAGSASRSPRRQVSRGAVPGTSRAGSDAAGDAPDSGGR